MLNVEELLMKLVQFPSLSGKEKDLADWLEQYICDTKLLTVERHEDNLLFHFGDRDPWLLLNSHSDVVPPSPDHYLDPFKPVLKDSKIYGRGTTDAKGCGSSMLTAIMELASEGYKPEGRVSFALTVCEEGIGINNGMDKLRKLIPKPDAAIVGEPTSLEPCIAQKGLLILKLITYGESGHAARVKGKNAIFEIGKVLTDLGSCQFDYINPFLGQTKITPTQIHGGTANNMAPEKAEIILDVRTIPEVTNEEIISTLKEKLDAEVVVVSDRYLATSTNPESVIARSVKEAARKEFIGSPTASDWVFLHDIPTIKIGPGHSPQSHTKNESVEVSQLYAGVKLYKKIIKNFFKNYRES